MELAHRVPIKTNPARGPLFCPEFDSPEEEEGFEPQSPQDVRPFRDSPFRSCGVPVPQVRPSLAGGTGGSNPLSSSGESIANLTATT